MEQISLSVRRLINRRVAMKYLQQFAPLLPEVAFALVDNDGHRVVEVRYEGSNETLSRDGADLNLPLVFAEQTVGALVASGPGLAYANARTALESLHHSLMLIMERAIESRSLAQETLERYREINLLYNIGETISASLDPDEIPDLVMAEAARIIRADGGVVLLLGKEADWDKSRELIARSGFGDKGFPMALHRVVEPMLPQALESGIAYIWTVDQIVSQRSVQIIARTSSLVDSILLTPLKGRERLLGFVLLGRGKELSVFTADDEKLLTALASQAGIAMENAQLFADVKSQRDAIAAMKNYMDNIFASIASGVITTDERDHVTTINRAAERILLVSADEIMGQPYLHALPGMGVKLTPLLRKVRENDNSVVGYELEPILPKRGQVMLRLNLSPLKDNHEITTGIAIVMDDLTEQHQLKLQVRQIRQTFEQYVVPRVVEQLLSDPNSVRLGGVRHKVTVLFSDIRGFTSFSEKREPEESVEVLNHYLTLAAEAILAEEGTLDKFLGDGVMAIYNAPLTQEDHVLRAVRSALAIRDAIAGAHKVLPEEAHLSFGVGITTGYAVIGSIGSTKIRNYTAIGDSVNMASRLQSHAKEGEILLNLEAYEVVRDLVIGRELGYIQLKGHSEPDLVFQVLDLK
ncbi:MAG: GAF domain-containing protein [Anaerolineae bacterium]|nr:GAF domain-containing protein [Anaerolineae bacterium]